MTIQWAVELLVGAASVVVVGQADVVAVLVNDDADVGILRHVRCS